jgi:hypothetical protein
VTNIDIKEDEMAGFVARMGRKGTQLIGGKARRKVTTKETKMYVGRMDLAEMEWGGVILTGLVWLRIGTSGELS